MRAPGDLVAAAQATTGLHDLGEPTWHEGLEQLVASARAEAELHDLGRAVLEQQVVRSLANRLRVVDQHRREPSLAEAPVVAPTFVVGLPRTGSTLVSALLHADPAVRSLLRWEALDSVPPPEAATLASDPRIAVAAAEQQALDELRPRFRAIHHEEPDGPTECVTLLGQDLRSLHFETLAHLPGYGRWHLGCDMAPAYRWHRRVLQVLQWRAPGRWVLKSPAHALALDAVVDTYPDARFVVLHRDPARVLPSLCSLVRELTSLTSDVDRPREVGQRWLEVAGAIVDRLLDHRRRHGDDRFVDVAYADLVRDPLATVGATYDALGWHLGADVERAMADHLRRNPQGVHGPHRYALADVGLRAEAVGERFAAYRDRFAVEAEPED